MYEHVLPRAVSQLRGKLATHVVHALADAAGALSQLVRFVSLDPVVPLQIALDTLDFK